jgi:hypothetical protein
MSSELLSQITALVADAEASRADATKWHDLIGYLMLAGYGPRLTPEIIAALVPEPKGIMEIVVASQEVEPMPPASPKMARRKLDAADRAAIRDLAAKNYTPVAIANKLGIARSVVEQELASGDV